MFNPYPKPEPRPKKSPKRIPARSTKQASLERRYNNNRRQFLRLNPVCPVTGGRTDQVHHMKGREGYADEQARAAGIPLLLDERYWLAVSDAGHKKIEAFPAWAKEMNYSLSRLSNVE